MTRLILVGEDRLAFTAKSIVSEPMALCRRGGSSIFMTETGRLIPFEVTTHL